MERPMHPRYADLKERLKSFSGWPAHQAVEPSQLAAAGFFFTGSLDRVRCFSCGVRLRDWKAGENPWIEHSKYSPNCAFIKQFEQEDFVNIYRGLNKSCCTLVDELGRPLRGAGLKEEASEDVCIDEGSVQEKCTRSGNEDNKYHSETGEPDLPVPNLIDPNCKDVLPVETVNFAIANMEETGSERERLLEENCRLKRIVSCRICCEQERCILFLPCAHLVSCQVCAEGLSNCDICRGIINEKVRIYY